MKIGFIGVGMMGAGMASNMQKGGHELVVNDLTRQAASRHLNAGATWAESPRAVAEACDVVFTSLPTPADVQKVGTGENGLMEGLRPGSAWFDLSTNAVDVVRSLHAQFAEKGVAFPRCAGQRRAVRREQRQAGDLGRRRQGDVRQIQGAARRDGRSGAVYRSDRCRNDRQAGAQRGGRGGERRAVRGVHHGREGRRRAAAVVRGDPSGRRRPGAAVRPDAEAVPHRRLRSAGFRAAPAAQGRFAGVPTGARGQRADAADQPGASGTDRGDEPRLGNSAIPASARCCSRSGRASRRSRWIRRRSRRCGRGSRAPVIAGAKRPQLNPVT